MQFLHVSCSTAPNATWTSPGGEGDYVRNTLRDERLSEPSTFMYVQGANWSTFATRFAFWSGGCFNIQLKRENLPLFFAKKPILKHRKSHIASNPPMGLALATDPDVHMKRSVHHIL